MAEAQNPGNTTPAESAGSQPGTAGAPGAAGAPDTGHASQPAPCAPEPPLTPEAIFLEFHVPETREWAKHFLTIASGTLVLSLTFAEKIIGIEDLAKKTGGTEDPLRRELTHILGTAWLLMCLAIIFAGLGIFWIFRAGARASGVMFYPSGFDFRTFAGLAYGALSISGFLYTLSLIALTILGIKRFW